MTAFDTPGRTTSKSWACFAFLALCACGAPPIDAGNSGFGPGGTSFDTGDETGDDGTDKFDFGDGMETAGDEGGTGGTACEQAAKAKSNQGCEFWAVDLPNAWAVGLGPAAEEQTFALVITNVDTEVASVAVYAGDEQTALASADIAAGALHVFPFDNSMGIDPADNSKGRAYRIESDRPVTAYQFNPLDNSTEVYSNDASLLFPTHVLDADYTAITGDGMMLGTVGNLNNAGAFVTAVATEDDTYVTVYPTEGVEMYPGNNVAVLNRGETFTMMSNAVKSIVGGEAGQGNLSGTRVEADKPIAVFSGNVASFEPTPMEGCCADHLEHQMLPLTAWATSYLVSTAAPNDASNDDPVRVRIVGSFDGTELSYSPAPPPGAPTTIGAYETATFTTSSSFSVSGDQPFAVAQFLLSNEVITPDPTPDDDADNGWWPGDPAMILVPPIDQLQQEYVYFVPAEYEKNFLTVMRPTGATVLIDGTDVTGDVGWSAVADANGIGWEQAHFPMSFGPHHVETDAVDGIEIIVAGYSPAVSFGYAGGSGVSYIDQPPPPPPEG